MDNTDNARIKMDTVAASPKQWCDSKLINSVRQQQLAIISEKKRLVSVQEIRITHWKLRVSFEKCC